jgi:hypothetical protein
MNITFRRSISREKLISIVLKCLEKCTVNAGGCEAGRFHQSGDLERRRQASEWADPMLFLRVALPIIVFPNLRMASLEMLARCGENDQKWLSLQYSVNETTVHF